MEIKKNSIAYIIFSMSCILHAEVNSNISTIRTFDPPKDCLLPQKIQDYKLQVLEKTKSVFINFNGNLAEVSVPIFIYVPTTQLNQGVDIISQGLEKLEELSKKSDWSQEELSSVIDRVKHGLKIIDDNDNNLVKQ
jgi:hypothetical protein